MVTRSNSTIQTIGRTITTRTYCNRTYAICCWTFRSCCTIDQTTTNCDSTFTSRCGHIIIVIRTDDNRLIPIPCNIISYNGRLSPISIGVCSNSSGLNTICLSSSTHIITNSYTTSSTTRTTSNSICRHRLWTKRHH